MISDMMERVDADNARKSILYCLGDNGTNVIAAGSFHAETINMLGKNVAGLSDVVSSGAGNDVDLEQILLWDPEVTEYYKLFYGCDLTQEMFDALMEGAM